MGIWGTLKRALGLEPALVVRPLEALSLTDDAVRHVVGLPDGHGVQIHLAPVPAGWLIQITEGPVPTPSPAFPDLRVEISPEDLARLVGLELDVLDGRWRVLVEVRVRSRETPNPNGRLYLTDRVLADGRAYFAPGAAAVPWLVAQLLDRPDVRSVLVRDHTLTVEREPDRPWDPIDAAVVAAIQEHALAAGPRVAPRAVGDRDSLERAVWEVLEHHVLPGIHRDGGDLEMVGIEDGIVQVHLVGACASCPASTLTLKGAIERTLLETFPGEVDSVEAV